jgi:hypothetical protein
MSLDRVRSVSSPAAVVGSLRRSLPYCAEEGQTREWMRIGYHDAIEGWVSVADGFAVLMLLRLTGLLPIVTDYESVCPWPSDGLATRYSQCLASESVELVHRRLLCRLARMCRWLILWSSPPTFRTGQHTGYLRTRAAL